MRVRLTANLTRYDSRLTGGQEGDTTGRVSHLGDRFTFVLFDCGANLDVLWESIEVIDEAFLAAAKKRRDEEDIQLAQAADAVLHLGPNGGFKSLSYRLGATRTTNGLKDEAARIMAVLKSHGIPIREEREERARDTSQNSMSSKEECGRIAREAIAKAKGDTDGQRNGGK